MYDLIYLLLGSLAVFRLAELIAVDNGPWHVFKRLRAWAAPRPMLQELLSCPYCEGIHWAFWCAAWYARQGYINWSDLPVWWLAMAGGAVVILRSVRERK